MDIGIDKVYQVLACGTAEEWLVGVNGDALAHGGIEIALCLQLLGRDVGVALAGDLLVEAVELTSLAIGKEEGAIAVVEVDSKLRGNAIGDDPRVVGVLGVCPWFWPLCRVR